MQVIYEPKGKAREYSPLALNIYNGCDHLCKYCYVQTSMGVNQFNGVKPRKDLLKAIESDCRNNEITKQVLLSFTGDPYCNEDINIGLTRKVLEILLKYQIPVAILSKGGNRCLRDLDLFKQFDNIKVGATLTFDNNEHSKYYEPGAANPDERFETLKILHEYKIKTFVSLEPVFSEEQTLNIINMTYPFVDHFKIGKLNHYKVRKEVDWKSFLNNSVNLCLSLNKEFYIKEDLWAFNDSLDINNKYLNKDYLCLKKENLANKLF